MRTALVALVIALGLGCSPPPPSTSAVSGGDPSRGTAALRRHGCGGCHRIPGLPEARGAVGPSLEGLAARSHIAGRLANRPLNLVHWIVDPRAVDPGTAMPDLGVSEADARDIAAYLYARTATSTPAPRWPPTEPPAAER